ncbi:MAG: hypothetical protein WC873_02380 [Candidatus Gracilibacteria bacterium]
MKKYIAIIVLLTQVLMAPQAWASIKGSKVNTVACVKAGVNGGIGFEDFINGFMFAQGFTDEVIEPWRDALISNQCQANDLFSLIDQENGIQKEIRKAFLSCNTKNLDKLEKAYRKVVVEIYYVRHVISRKATFNLPFGFISTKPDITDTPKDKLYSEMAARFVTKKEYFKEDEFSNFFNNMEAKYKDRVPTYKACANSSWQDVVLKWEEFKTEMTDGFGIEDALNETEKRAKHVADVAVDMYKSFTTEEGFKAWVSGLVEINVNNLPAKEGFQAIFDRLKSETNYSFVTQGRLIQAGSEVDTIYKNTVSKTEMASRFHALYVNGDVGIQSFMDELDKLDKAINDTYPLIDGVKACTAAMNKRQCPGQ